VALHPELPLLMTGGRDSTCRLWDMRTRVQVHCMSGHQSTVASILSHGADPQVITGSHDNTIRTWDLRTGKTMQTLTYHKKSVRALAMSPNEVRLHPQIRLCDAHRSSSLMLTRCDVHHIRFISNVSGLCDVVSCVPLSLPWSHLIGAKVLHHLLLYVWCFKELLFHSTTIMNVQFNTWCTRTSALPRSLP
jgi:WD40 repeat protein